MSSPAEWLRRLPLIRDLLRSSENAEAARAYLRQLTAVAIEEHVAERILTQPRYLDPRRLNRSERQMYSQHGEDGILAEIFARIGEGTRTFVEFGVGDGLENNTLALLVQGWRGVWIEADQRKRRRIRRHVATHLASGALSLGEAAVTAENIEKRLWVAGVPDEPDLMSIDIDGNDYWVWQAIKRVRPRVVVVEYNALFPPPLRLVKSYEPQFRWNGTSYFGASLKALELLGADKGYNLVGCDLSGANAFFVRGELCGDRFAAPFTAEHHFEPPRYYLARHAGHPAGVGAYDTV